MPFQRDRVFISYRRSDAGASATAIRKTLVDRFGEGAVFYDVSTIDPGADFPETLRNELERAAVVLALMGNGWLRAANEYGQRRIDFDDDWVVIELSKSLKDPEVTVIPVLVDGAHMPPPAALPPSLKPLASRNAVTLRHEAWDETAEPLLETVGKVLQPRSSEIEPEAIESAVTRNFLRQEISEAFAAIDTAGGQVLLATVGEIARLVALMCARGLHADEKIVMEFLLRCLIGRPLDRVTGYLREVLRSTLAFNATHGKWLGYAMREGRDRYEAKFSGCVLILPQSSVAGGVPVVVGAVVTESVELDFYGAQANEPPGPYESVSAPVVAVGTTLYG